MKRISLFCIIVFIGLCVVFLFIYFSKNETRISSDIQDEKEYAFVCEKNSSVDSFFWYKGEKSPMHQIKIVFKNDAYKKLSYTYRATYDSEDAAENAISYMLGKYNRYMSTIGIYQEDLFPVFSATSEKVAISIYIDYDKTNVGTMKLLSLDENDYMEIDENNLDSFREVFVKKGFTCQYGE